MTGRTSNAQCSMLNIVKCKKVFEVVTFDESLILLIVEVTGMTFSVSAGVAGSVRGDCFRKVGSSYE